MKIGVLSDIHGNNYALEQVLLSAKKEKVEKLLVLGDIVGYYYQPDTVMNMIGDWDYVLIRGNHENLLAGLQNGTLNAADLRMKYGSGHQEALKKLPMTFTTQLINAPQQLRVELENVTFLMCHGSPWDPDLYLYPDSSVALLGKCDRPDVNFVLIGHSHYPFLYRNKHSTLINVGSVGQSRKTGGIANWALINTTSKTTELMATPYDTSQLEKEINRYDPDIAYLRVILKRGRV